MTMARSRQGCLDEETPLLHAKSKTPLPWRQFNLVLLALVAEPFSSTYIFPFINQLIGELGITGGDDRKIGYYAGLIESLFFVTQALTTWKWSHLSDSVGRRPIILLGLLGLSVSNLAFGLSRTLNALVISRCLAGLLNGNVGVMKSIVGDITDHTNMADAFSIVPAVFSVGGTIAPLYGGALVKPQERWPDVFRGEFWATYPYFLPSFVSGCFTISVFFLCAGFLKESLPSRRYAKPIEDSLDGRVMVDVRPVSMMTLMKMPTVMMPIVNYGALALVDIGFMVLLPLFYSSPIAIGGLGFPPSIIGTFLAVYGVVNGLLRALFVARIIEWTGPKLLFSWAILWFYPLILLFPIMSAVVMIQGKVGPIIWVLLVLQLVFTVIANMSYTVVSILITKSAPNNQSLGAVNGLAQSITSIARAIGPALTTTLFAVSKEYNILGGNLVYVVLTLFATILVLLSRHLPDLKNKE